MEKTVTKSTTKKKKVVESKEINLNLSDGVSSTSPVKKSVKKAGAAVATAEKTKKVLAKEQTKAEAAAPESNILSSAADAAVVESPEAEETRPFISPDIEKAAEEIEVSPAFKELAQPKLPALARENRARLLMQSPTRVYFYWSLRDNPYKLLQTAFSGETGSYTLVVKLINNTSGTEEIHPVDAEGNYWFNVEANSEYQAEIGFYATNRPYFRLVFSNKITTPRRNPSPRAATEADWKVKNDKFAEILNVAGFTRDAFDVAIAGDDYYAAETATHTAFTEMIGNGDHQLGGISQEDIRYAMLALASGVSLEELRWKISPALFAILQANSGNIEAEKAMAAVSEHFDVDVEEFTEEELGSAVYGASKVHFPRTVKTRTTSKPRLEPRYNPVSSHILGR